MFKIIISLLLSLGYLCICGCSVQKIPGVYRIEVQQGNVVDQEMVNRLHPGMDKLQVRFVLGSPILIDVFHQEQWEYIYRLQPGNGPETQKRLSLFFVNERLARVSGDWRPMPRAAGAPLRPEELVEVPVLAPKEVSLFDRILGSIGLLEE